MLTLIHIFAAGLLTRAVSIGIAAVLACRWLAGLSEKLLAVACGLLTAVAFTHLMPEAFEMPGVEAHELGLVMLGTVFLFLFLARFFSHDHAGADDTCRTAGRSTAATLMTGAALHNFVDGVLIASTFLMDERAGWLVALAVCCHEIPQTTGYMVILKNCGYETRRAVLLCVASALATLAGGVAGWAAVNVSHGMLPYALAACAASFLFITFHSLLPEVFTTHQSKKAGFGQLALFLVGILLSTVILGVGHGHDHGDGHAHDHDVPSVSAQPLEGPH